jgi:hypothetical protein
MQRSRDRLGLLKLSVTAKSIGEVRLKFLARCFQIRACYVQLQILHSLLSKGSQPGRASRNDRPHPALLSINA